MLLIKVYVVLVMRVLYAGPVTLSLCSLLKITVGRIHKRQQNVKIQRRLHCVAGFFLFSNIVCVIPLVFLNLVET